MHHQGHHPKIALAFRYDDGSESLILLSNHFFISSPLNTLNCCSSIPECLVRVRSSLCCEESHPHSGTRHLNWNVKVWQYPKPYPFNNSEVTQLCQGTCYSLADRTSKQDLDSVPSGKQRTKSTKNIPHLRQCIFSLLQIPQGLMGVTTLEYYWWRQSHLFVQQRPIQGLLKIKE